MSLDRIDWFKTAKTASLLAALALVAQSEWSLALAVGWPAWIAWAAFVALDSYILAAVRARRDLGPSVVVSAASVLGSHAVYAAPSAWASGVPGQGHLVWRLAAVCSVVPLLVTWRVHHLRLPDAETAAAAEPASDAPPNPVPVTSDAAEVQPDAVKSSPPKLRPATDAELAEVIAAELEENPKAGRGTIRAALAGRGLTPGPSERLVNMLADAKRQSIHTVPVKAAR